MGRVISVTRRHIDFLFPSEGREITRRIVEREAELLARLADGPLPATDDDHVGEETL